MNRREIIEKNNCIRQVKEQYLLWKRLHKTGLDLILEINSNVKDFMASDDEGRKAGRFSQVQTQLNELETVCIELAAVVETLQNSRKTIHSPDADYIIDSL